MRPRDDENTVWTDSQDYGSDEILSHPFTVISPVQRAACAMHFVGSLQESTEIIQLIKYLPTLFNLSRLLEGCVPRFSKRIFTKVYFQQINNKRQANRLKITHFLRSNPRCSGLPRRSFSVGWLPSRLVRRLDRHSAKRGGGSKWRRRKL